MCIRCIKKICRHRVPTWKTKAKGKYTMDGYGKNTVYCYGCGKDLTNAFKVPVDKGVICVECLHRDVARKKETYESLYRSTKNLTIAGVIWMFIILVIGIFSMSGNGDTYSVNIPEILWPFMILLVILELIWMTGFFFGIRAVFKWVSKWPVIIIVFSLLFFVLFFGMLFQVAAWIGWIIMIRDWRRVKRLKKEYLSSQRFMDKVLSNMNRPAY